MVHRSCIPGYDEAVAEERKLREEAFLSETGFICGFEVRLITPFLLALLYQMESPFVCGGIPTVASAQAFLWALSPSFKNDREARTQFIEDTTIALIEMGDGAIDDLYEAIDKFVNDTFFDAPSGGVESVPYVCSVAYLIYKMKCDPHRLTEQQAGNTPIRRIYQYVKCAQWERGEIMHNEISDAIKAKWLDELRSKSGNN